MDFSTGPYSGLGTPSGSIGFPALFGLDDAHDLLADCPSASVLLGVDGDGQPQSVDLDAESPHILVNASTGGGKSVTQRSVAAQHMARGGRALFLDVKRHSHRWAKDLGPLAYYAQTLPEIGNAIVKMGEEVHRRNAIVERWSGTVESAPVGDRWIVTFEEMNATIRALAELDKKLPAGEYRAMDAFRDTMFMGRAVKIHVVGSSQLATFRDTGGSEIIENFGARVLIRYSTQAWKYLASNCGHPVAAPDEPGRGLLCYGSKARETQLLYMSEEEARQFVLTSPVAQEAARRVSQSLRLPEPWRSAVRRTRRQEA